MAATDTGVATVGTKPLIKVEGLEKRFPGGVALVSAQSQLRTRGGRDLVRPGARRELWAGRASRAAGRRRPGDCWCV